jgi:hypothetical protein
MQCMIDPQRHGSHELKHKLFFCKKIEKIQNNNMASPINSERIGRLKTLSMSRIGQNMPRAKKKTH